MKDKLIQLIEEVPIESAYAYAGADGEPREIMEQRTASEIKEEIIEIIEGEWKN